jgi:secreted PhoX family phosphatase
MEGVAFNPNAPDHLYLAMSDVRGDMSDGQGDIDVTENRCGIIYRMTLNDQWNVNRIEPVISGGPYTSSVEYKCTVNSMAGPDNLVVLDGGQLLIGEDTDKHENNMVWLWQPVSLNETLSEEGTNNSDDSDSIDPSEKTSSEKKSWLSGFSAIIGITAILGAALITSRRD